jgi:predicted ABC-type ATPase
MAKRVFYLLAGPNGAGESSLYRAAVLDGLIPKEAVFVNADLHERDHLQDILGLQKRFEAARDWADARGRLHRKSDAHLAPASATMGSESAWHVSV